MFLKTLVKWSISYLICSLKGFFKEHRVVSDYDDIFQVLKGLPPKRQVEHEIQLQ
jgi:hypothetical protein